jgi:hypothetical protein
MVRKSKVKKGSAVEVKHKRHYIPVDFKKIKLEDNVPLPSKRQQKDEFLTFFTDMKVGQSFESHKRDRAKCRMAANDFQIENPGIKFVIRLEEDNEHFRMWKLKRDK